MHPHGDPDRVARRGVWDAVRDVGALHERLVPGFVLDTRLDGDARVVTFGNGLVLRELIVDLDDEARRLAWAARGGRFTHHHASVQVFADGTRNAVGWSGICDLLPHELAGDIGAMIQQAAAVMKKTLERRSDSPSSRSSDSRAADGSAGSSA